MRKRVAIVLFSGLFVHTALAAHEVVAVKLDARNNSGEPGAARDKTRAA